jgi:hypothetical protein
MKKNLVLCMSFLFLGSSLLLAQVGAPEGEKPKQKGGQAGKAGKGAKGGLVAPDMQMPNLPGVPALPGMPGKPGPGMPGWSGVPGMPGMPGAEPVPSLASKYKELLPTLIDGLKDADGQIRQISAAALANVGKEAVKPLLEALKGKDKELRANAAYVLGMMGVEASEAVPILITAVKIEDKETRRRAAYALYKILEDSPSSHPSAGSSPFMSPTMPAYYMPGMPGGPRKDSARPKIAAPPDPGLVLPAGTESSKIEAEKK